MCVCVVDRLKVEDDFYKQAHVMLQLWEADMNQTLECMERMQVSTVRLTQRRSWLGGSRGPDPPELPSGAHTKRTNLVRIFFAEGGGRGLGSH